jgi:hypothetical protein
VSVTAPSNALKAVKIYATNFSFSCTCLGSLGVAATSTIVPVFWRIFGNTSAALHHFCGSFVIRQKLR